jgi:hypothetical protein
VTALIGNARSLASTIASGTGGQRLKRQPRSAREQSTDARAEPLALEIGEMPDLLDGRKCTGGSASRNLVPIEFGERRLEEIRHAE